jgi:N-glycosylase/DNA lyase
MRYEPTIPLTTSKLKRLDIELLKEYSESYKDIVTKRLREFKRLRKAHKSRIFCEICFCILTPQSNALVCDRAVAKMDRMGWLKDPVAYRDEIGRAIRGIRFWRNKTKYILRAWKRFESEGGGGLKAVLLSRRLELEGNRELRNWLREEMRGMGVGMKEASHFLRNVGYWENLAIIDRHVLKCLCELGVLSDAMPPKSDTYYREFEEHISEFSSEIGLQMGELDLLLWSARTGYIFK